MAIKTITFKYLTGIKKSLFSNVRIQGSWDTNGAYNTKWSILPMNEITGEDGSPAFSIAINLDNSVEGQIFNWGVVLDGPGGTNMWGINTEINNPNTNYRYCFFTINGDATGQTETFYLTYKRRLGASPYFSKPGAKPKLQFSVWAPNATGAEVVFGPPNGYISDDGTGIDPKMPVIPLIKADDGIWTSIPLTSFQKYEGRYYMYRITNAQGQLVYRTDIFSRGLVGRGSIDPSNAPWDGTLETLDGTVSCSIITDPDTISSEFPLPTNHRPKLESTAEFWQNEFNPDRPIPTSIDDLVIYELHIGALGNTPNVPGNLQDAVDLLDYLSELGINAIELLPMAEFFGDISWGYGDTHHMVIQSSAGGRDEYRYFIRECHRRGIVVIQDVVYNHYDGNANRAEWAYDSNLPEQNIYYYYVNSPTGYPDPNDGYVNNGSTGWTPNFSERMVRQQFISAAAFLIDEMHVDGFRVDLTQAIHRDNTLNSSPYPQVGEANQFGAKFLREWGRTLRLIHPNVMLMAEDYTGYDMVTAPVGIGGFGFDATWFADFFHALVGYQGGPQLLVEAGFGDNRQLDLADFSTILYQSQFNKVVYHINHDDAGANNTHRTVVTAVNGAQLTGATITWAEMRSHVIFGLSLLSAGTPLFFMGEEIAAQKPYTYDKFLVNREDLQGDKAGTGANMFRYYQDLLTINKRYASIRSKNIDILMASNSNRVIIFKRWYGTEQILIAASLNNNAFQSFTLNSDAYRLPDGGWKEVFNSDATIYGGSNTGNYGAVIPSANGSITMVIPANGLVVFVMEAL
jgi:1,4-alpha-glucan branching enzyme